MNRKEIFAKKNAWLLLLALFSAGCIPPPGGYRWYYVRHKDTLWSISRKNKVDVINLINANNLKDPSLIYPGMRLKIPANGAGSIAKAPSKHRVKHATYGRLKKKPKGKRPAFGWPAKGKIVENFGKDKMHRWQGIVIKAAGGRITAAAPGRVSFCGDVYPFGRTIIIKHSGGYHTVYSYLKNYAVKPGDRVSKSSVIASAAGNRKFGSGALYFEIRYMTEACDPMLYLE